METQLDKEAVVRGVDMHITLPSLLLDPNGAKRRKFYGGAGSYRPKSYGVECRSPSNFWVFQKAYRRWVFRQTEHVVSQVAKGQLFKIERVRQIIDSDDAQAAEAFINEYQIVLP